MSRDPHSDADIGHTLEPPPLPQANGSWALFLDVDGTLIDFAATPDAVRVPPGLVELLGRLAESLDGALALLSGRQLADLDRLFAPLQLPAAGVHGLERRGADHVLRQFTPDETLLARLRVELETLTAGQSGLLLEDKGTSLALHYRNAPQAEGRVIAAAEALAQSTQGRFEVQRGQLVCELKPAGIDKGAALAAFLDEPPFSGRTPVCIGDDLTDEHAFAAAQHHDGITVIVGSRRPTEARFALDSPAELHHWLHGLLRLMSGGVS